MSSSTGDIDGALSRFEASLDAVEATLAPLLDAKNLDALTDEEPPDRKVVPTAKGSYALGALLYAYAQSEGEDVAKVNEELARIQQRLQRLSKPDGPSDQAQQSS